MKSKVHGMNDVIKVKATGILWELICHATALQLTATCVHKKYVSTCNTDSLKNVCILLNSKQVYSIIGLACFDIQFSSLTYAFT